MTSRQFSPLEDPRFVVFWQKYPHKVAKIAARRAFANALFVTDFTTLMDGLRAYPFDPNPNFWPLPTTWLNQGRWEGVQYTQPETTKAPAPTRASWMDTTPSCWPTDLFPQIEGYAGDD